MYQRFCGSIKNFRRSQAGITGLETAIILIAFVTVASVLAYSVLSAGIFSAERGKAAVYAGLSSAQSTMSLKGSVVGIASVPAADPELGSISSTGGLIMLEYLILQAGLNPMLETFADDTVTVTLDPGVTGTATSGVCTVAGSPVALHAGANILTTHTPGPGGFDIFLVAPPGGPVANALTSVTFNLALAISGDSIDLNNLVLNYWDSKLGVTAMALDKTASGTATPTSTTGDWSYFLTDKSSSSILRGTLEAVITVMIPAGAQVGSYDTFTIQVNPPTGASITIQRSLGPIAPVMSLN